MKAIIELRPRGSALANARAQLATRKKTKEVDYRLTFESAKTLFSELTPARIDALEHLRANGPLSIYALAKQLGRHYSNVHTDIAKLIEHRLVEKNDADQVFVPWDAVEIHMAIAKAA